MVKINSYYDHNKFLNLLTFKIHHKKMVERKVLVAFFVKNNYILFLTLFLVFFFLFYAFVFLSNLIIVFLITIVFTLSKNLNLYVFQFHPSTLN